MSNANSSDQHATEWSNFFDRYAYQYENECFTKNTVAEVDFLIKELELTPGAFILDLGCGTGRHSVELAKRGYTVTGLDISQGMLQEAQRHAQAAGVQITWVHAHATSFHLDTLFDAVICLCEGAFGLLGTQDDPIQQPLAILRNAANVMKPKAKCLFTVLNGYAIARKYSQAKADEGQFDPLSLTERSECNLPDQAVSLPLRERGFVPTELRLLFEIAQLKVLQIWGGTAGNWGKRGILLDEIEIMVLGQK